jgi:hypothetical protein
MGLSKKHFDYLTRAEPHIEFCEESNEYIIAGKGGSVIYDGLPKEEASAIFEAHNLLGWDKEYEQLLDYLEKNYPDHFA